MSLDDKAHTLSGYTRAQQAREEKGMGKHNWDYYIWRY